MEGLPKKLEVMAEYESSGIWVTEDIGPFRHGMIEHRDLNVPQDLAAKFNSWIAKYYTVIDNPSFDYDSFNEVGRQLARQLQEVLGADTEVTYEAVSDTE